MDFHKLQHTLNEIEPSDRNRDIELLRQAAQGNNSPEPRQEVSESAGPVASTPTPIANEPMDEAAQMAALAGVTPAKQQLNTEMLDEARQMAALAGIPMNEGQKKGKAGQLKGKDKVSKSSHSKSGEQKNVTRGKLVGSAENDDESIEEGPKWDAAKKGWEHGKKNFNTTDLLTKPIKNKLAGKNKGKSSKSDKSSSKQETGLPPKLAQDLAKYSTALSKISRDPKLKQQFQDLMKAADPNLQLEHYTESYSSPKKEQKKNVSESMATSSEVSSIKEDLLRRLNNRK